MVKHRPQNLRKNAIKKIRKRHRLKKKQLKRQDKSPPKKTSLKPHLPRKKRSKQPLKRQQMLNPRAPMRTGKTKTRTQSLQKFSSSQRPTPTN